MLCNYDPPKYVHVAVCLFLLFLGCEQTEEPLQVPRSAALAGAPKGEAPLYAPSPSSHADSLLDLAENHIEAARYDSAVTLAQLAGKEYKKIDYKEGMIRSSAVQGDALERWGKYDDALRLLEEKLELAHEWLGPEHLLVGDIRNKMGIIYRHKGDFTNAIENNVSALEIREKHLGGNHSLVGRSKNNIGVIHAELGDFDRALAFYKEALSIRETALGSKNDDVAQDYNNIAVALKNKGDYDESLFYHDQALSIRQKVFGDEHPAVGASYYNIGVTYGAKGDFDKALENHERSHNIWVKAFPQGHPLIGQSLNAISIDHQELQNYNEALKYEERSLEQTFRTLGEQHLKVGSSYQNIALIHQRRDEHSKALEYLQKSISIWNDNEVKQHPALARVYYYISNLYYMQGLWNEALRQSNLSLQANHLSYEPFSVDEKLEINDYASDWTLLQVLILRARIHTALGEEEGVQQLQRALETYEAAVKVIEAHSLSFKNNGSKLLLAEQASLMYEEAIQVALQLHRLTREASYLDTAFQFAELGKASVLIDAMNEADALKQAGIPDSLLEREKGLRLLLTYHDRDLKSLVSLMSAKVMAIAEYFLLCLKDAKIL